MYSLHCQMKLSRSNASPMWATRLRYAIIMALPVWIVCAVGNRALVIAASVTLNLLQIYSMDNENRPDLLMVSSLMGSSKPGRSEKSLSQDEGLSFYLI